MLGIATLVSGLTCCLWAWAPEAAPPVNPAEPPPAKFAGKAYDPSEDPIEAFVPKTPRTEADVKRLDGLAWWSTGQILETRGDNRGAYDAYKKGFAQDPRSLALVRKLMGMAFALNEPQEGMNYAQKALELDPGDYRLLRRVAAIVATEEPSKAIEMLERARQAPDLPANTAIQVSILLDLGILYRETGHKQEAAECLKVVFDAQINPEKYGLDNLLRKQLLANPEIDFEKLGQVFLDGGNPDLALQAYQKAQELKRGGQGSHAFNLANLYLQTSKPELALQELQTYFDAQRQTKGRAAYELLSKILTALNRSGELLAKLEELHKKDSKNTTLAIYLADQYAAVERYSDAEPLYKAAIDKQPDLDGYRGLALLHRKQDRIADLIVTLGRALEKQSAQQPDKGLQQDLQTIISDDVLLGKVLGEGRKILTEDASSVRFSSVYLLLRLAVQAKQFEPADQFFQAAIKARRGALVSLVELYADALFKAADFVRAIKLYDDALQENGISPEQRVEFLCQLVRLHELNGQTDLALQSHAKALELAPGFPYVHYLEGWVYSHAGEYEKSIAAFEKVIARFSDNKPLMKFVRSGLSNAYVLQGDLPKGEAILEEMFKEDPQDPGLNNDLGYLWADQGKNLDQAEGMIRKAIKADPENNAYLDSLAWVLYKRGKYEEALTHMEKAIAEAGASDATLWEHLGDIYERLQKTDKAVEAWNKSLTSAQMDKRPDAKLVARLTEKLKGRTQTNGQPKPETPGNP